MRKRTRKKTKAEVGLQYIADSPPREYGGFHPEAVKAAKAGLRLIARLRRLIARLRRKGHV